MGNFGTLVDLIIKCEMEGRPHHENILFLGETPSFLVDHAGFQPLKLAIKAKTVCKICFDHGISTTAIKRLPDIVSQPKGVYRPASGVHGDSVVILTFELKGSAPVIIPIRKNETVGRAVVVNSVSSMYAKEGPDPERKWANDGLLLWRP